MSAHPSKYLLGALLGVLAARGVGAEELDPWRGWVAFKQFAREVAEKPDPGISAQIAPLGDHLPIRLSYVRQVIAPEGDRLEPTGGIVCEFCFAPRRRTPAKWEAWSFDWPTFDRFVDGVEQHPLFIDLLATRPLHTAIYCEEA